MSLKNKFFSFLKVSWYGNFLYLCAVVKIFYNIRKVQGGLKSNDLFKKLEGTSIWEFRTLYNGIQYRLFAFWDTEEETLVVATHGIVKKVWRIPSKEIAKAEAIREEYFKTK